MLNQKMQYNYTNDNYIPELLMAYSVVVVDGVFLWNGVNILFNRKCGT